MYTTLANMTGRQSSLPPRLPWRPILNTLGLALCLGALPIAKPAVAQDVNFVLHAEPAAAFWVDDPQGTRFTPGFYGALRPGVSLGRVVSLQWSYALLAAPPKPGFTETGAAHLFTAGLRLRPLATLRPPTDRLGGLFVDFNLGYARTGDLDRFGFDAGLGYGFQAGRGFALGPVVRYGQIVQPDDLSLKDPNDAQFVTLGLNLSFGTSYSPDEDPPEVAALECPEAEVPPTPPAPVCAEPEKQAVALACPDYDVDGVCDREDRCPTQPGPASALGCVIDPCGGDPLVVVVQFGYDSAGLPSLRPGDSQTLDPVLDAVAAAVAQDPTCRVCVVGYASQEGSEAYNLELSGRRSKSVQGYLVASGIAKSRTPTRGLGESCQLIPEASLSLNRRVEFRRLEEGESCPSDCSQEITATSQQPSLQARDNK